MLIYQLLKYVSKLLYSLSVLPVEFTILIRVMISILSVYLRWN